VVGGGVGSRAVIAEGLARYIAGVLRVKTLVDWEGRVVGLYCYRSEGYYVPCQSLVLSEMLRLCREWGLLGRVGDYLAFKKMFVKALINSTRLEGGFDHYLVLFGNGVLDWRCLESGGGSRCLMRPGSDLLVVHRVPWEVDVGVLFRSFSGREELAREIEADAELGDVVNVFRQWAGDRWFALFEVIGYTFLAGDYPLGRVVVLYGEGANGKSTFLRLVTELLGEGNVSYVCLPDLAGRNRFATAELYGKMANVCEDLPGRVSREVVVLERLAGGGLVEARRKFKGSFAFRNYAKLLFATSVVPRVGGAGSASWDRWYLIEFPNRFPRAYGFEERFFGELLPRVAPKLIAYSILAALQAVRERRFAFEGEGADLREAWLRAANSAYAFIKTALKLGVLEEDREGYVDAEWLYDTYVAYCRAEGREALVKSRFTAELSRLFGYRKVKLDSRHYYKGIRVANDTLTLKLWGSSG